jgi:hypothetical protein
MKNLVAKVRSGRAMEISTQATSKRKKTISGKNIGFQRDGEAIH